MFALMWITGLVRRRFMRLSAVAVGIAIAVGLLASIGSFVSHSKATMTQRSAATVAVDWQEEAQTGADLTNVQRTIQHQRGVTAALTVGFARAASLTATSESAGLPATPGHSGTAPASVQTTGAAVVLGLPNNYRSVFPEAIRDLAGAANGVLVAQQTAANLHVAPGDRIMIGRVGLPDASVTVAGVVDLPQSQSLFQEIGAATGAQPKASPDHVLLLPNDDWHRVFDPLTRAHPELVRTQFHIRLDHGLAARGVLRVPAVAGARAGRRARDLPHHQPRRAARLPERAVFRSELLRPH